MTRKKALSIVDSHVTQNLQGAGTGIREIPPVEAREKAVEALSVLFKSIHGREPYGGELVIHQLRRP